MLLDGEDEGPLGGGMEVGLAALCLLLESRLAVLQISSHVQRLQPRHPLLGVEHPRQLQEGGLEELYRTIDGPLIPLLARMERRGIRVDVRFLQKMSKEMEVDLERTTLGDVEANIVRCPDAAAAAEMEKRIDDARERGDSLGGVVECVARGVPPGLGEPVFDKLEADLACALMSLPASKGFEIGSGFGGTRLTGIQHNDPFEPGPDGRPHTTSNRSGGVQGGISNGESIHLRVAFKPTATIRLAQQTVDREGRAVTLEAQGRHDPCVLPRAVPMVEAMVCLVLADHWLRQQSTDSLPR